MNLLLPSEIALFAPVVAAKKGIADETGQNRFIVQASSILYGACGGSLEIIPYYDEEIRLDMNLSGKLRQRQFKSWIDETASIFPFGDEVSGFTVRLSDFSVLKRSGVIRNLSTRLGSRGNGIWSGPSSGYESPYELASEQYHSANGQVVQDNSKPNVMRASYYAGWFVEQTLAAAGASGVTAVVLADVSFLERGREFYFSSDVPDNAPTVDRRITAINTTTKTVTFTPAVEYGLNGTEKLRMIDKNVRSSCADIIADLLIYPPNTRDYSRGLSKGDLQNHWTRMNDQMLPINAAVKLSRYRRG